MSYRRKRTRTGKMHPTLLGALGAAFLIALWWCFTHAATDSTLIASMSPENIPPAALRLLDRGVLTADIGVSLWRLLSGLTIAALVGVPLGLALGFSQTIERISNPPIQFLRMVSPLSWAPLTLALFGIGSAPVIFLVAVAAVWPITLSTVSGVRALNKQHLHVAKTLGASPAETFTSVIVPSLKPPILSGVRLALGIAWVIIVPAEMLGVSSGLGYEILNARDRLAYDEMLVVILVIGTLGMLLDTAAQKLLK